ncbi:MAG: PAS domain S-box protein [Desulfobacterota bacterium]|nr:PAS domain S-box protein [Thermodesulfobacteriota bacterium]
MTPARILIVEDESTVALYIQKLLEDAGHRVSGVVGSAAQAFESIEKEQPDLVLMDIILQGGREGIEAAERIGKLFGIPVVYLTACTDQATVEAAQKTAPYGYITKPFEPRELFTTVGLVLERARLEKALRENEERYRMVLGNIHIGILEIVYDEGLQKAEYRYVNPALVRIFGYESAEEFMAVPLEKLYADPVERAQVLDELKARDVIDERIVRGRKKNGTEVWLSLSAILHAEGEGKRVLYGAVQDITERRLLEQKARESEERFRQIFEQENDAFFILELPHGVIMDANTAATQLYGCAREELSGIALSCFCGAQAWEELRSRWERGERDFIIYRQDHNRKNGTTVPVAVRGKVIEVNDREMLVLSVRDITEKLKLEEEAALRQAQLLQSDKMASIGTLAAGIAHEINNPTAFVLSNLGTLQKYCDRLIEFIELLSRVVEQSAPEAQRAAIAGKRAALKIDYVLKDMRDLIVESISGAERVKKIVNDLKSFARPDTGEHTLTDLHECIEKTLNIVWNELKYTCTVEKQYGDIPFIKCNPQQMSQVFMNLLVNAAHAIKKQGTITIRTWQEADGVRIAVSDTGCGIPPEHLTRVFEPFFTTKEVGKGTGLGLSIVYDIIKKHNGEITVESEVGKGTTFTVRLPVAS